MKKYYLAAIIVLVTQIILVSNVLAASIAIVPTGAGTYDVQGTGLTGVGGINLVINYSSMTSPTVTKGALIGAAMLVANTTVPGSIRIAIINTNTFSGSGSIAAISFASRNNGTITLASASMIDGVGANIATDNSSSSTAASGVITTPGLPFSTPTATPTPPATTSTTTTTTSTTTATTPVSVGTIAMPADSQPSPETKPEDGSGTSAKVPTPAADETNTLQKREPDPEMRSEPQKPVEVKQIAYSSILDRFRTFTGEKTPATMTALFTQNIAPTVRQEPQIAVSDGKTTVRIFFTAQSSETNAPSFSLNGAKMISLKNGDGPRSWLLEALPQAGATKASVTILTSASVMEFPLTIVPALRDAAAMPPDFAVFLKDTGAKPPRYDLNGDGIHDYQDNFIYTAHHLLRKAASGEQKSNK